MSDVATEGAIWVESSPLLGDKQIYTVYMMWPAR